MTDLRHGTTLAHEIGLDRIASVVDTVFNQMKNQPAFASIFNVSETHDDDKARLTYFWWVALGATN
jgi:truncated hemoglobin YjbI